LAYRAGRDLFPQESAGLLTLGVLGTSVGSFMMPMLVGGAHHEGLELALPLLPVLCHGAAIGLDLRRRWRGDRLGNLPAWRLLGFVGLVTFPLPLALGFTLLARAGQGGEVLPLLARLGPTIALVAVSVSAGGLFVTQRTRDDARLPMIAGTGVAFLGLI